MNTLWPSSKHLPDVVFVELVAILFTALLPILTIGVVTMGVGALIAAREGDAAIFALTIACVLTTIVRVLFVLGYRRRLARSQPTAQEAKVWERRYALGSFLFAILLGALSARALMLGDPLVSTLIVGLIFGYGSGLVTRVAVRPAICVTSLFLATVPIVISLGIETALATGLSDIAIHSGQTLLVAGFALASLETVAHGYQTTLQQLLTKRDLAVLAGNDALTGLPNRMQLRSRFSESVLHIKQTGDLLAFHCLDLDRFKAVNDTFGHPTGDALLQAVGTRLARTLKATDTAARLGGDEFVVVQPGIRHTDEARLLAQRIIRVLSDPYVLDGREIRIGVSIGIALYPCDGLDLEQLTSRADAALYQAKREARGCAMFWSPPAAPAPAATETGRWKALRRSDSGRV
ncbi:MAG TPA: GGDEF domain-containing protein [Steroidobacteraceae bacterium]|nr:GGDEF domain-containing protein [Steroidobacteraceae bacterium]